MKSVHEGIKFFTLYHYITIKENLKKSRPQTKEILNLFRLNEHYTKTFQSRKIVQTEVLVECVRKFNIGAPGAGVCVEGGVMRVSQEKAGLQQ